MSLPKNLSSVTLQVGVTSMELSRTFYDALFGGPPSLVISPDLVEYEPHPGFWLQLSTGTSPGTMKRLRFGVDDIQRIVAELAADGVECSPMEQVEGLVMWCDFADPDGNPLGLYQDLSGS